MLAAGLRATLVIALVAACNNPLPAAHEPSSVPMPPSPTPYPTKFGVGPISSLVVDDYASGGILTVPAGTQFGLELSGGGWQFHLPESYDPYVLVRGPGPWDPDLGFVGPGNCDSASPCGGEGIVFKAIADGYGDLIASDGTYIAFDLHIQVRSGPIVLDLPAVPIINEALSTGVTAPIGSTVNVHSIGNWGPPQPQTTDLQLFKENGMSTSGVVSLVQTAHAMNESIYSYGITGKGGYSYQFEYRDPSAFAAYYTIAFDIR